MSMLSIGDTASYSSAGEWAAAKVKFSNMTSGFAQCPFQSSLSWARAHKGGLWPTLSLVLPLCNYHGRLS